MMELVVVAAAAVVEAVVTMEAAVPAILLLFAAAADFGFFSTIRRVLAADASFFPGDGSTELLVGRACCERFRVFICQVLLCFDACSERYCNEFTR